jgi:hypothetical protein
MVFGDWTSPESWSESADNVCVTPKVPRLTLATRSTMVSRISSELSLPDTTVYTDSELRELKCLRRNVLKLPLFSDILF